MDRRVALACRGKVHITENSERLQRGVRLEDLRFVYEVVMAQDWKLRS